MLNLLSSLLHRFEQVSFGQQVSRLYTTDINAEIVRKHSDVNATFESFLLHQPLELVCIIILVYNKLHYEELETYIQGIWREGHDGKPAFALLLLHTNIHGSNKEVLEYQNLQYAHKFFYSNCNREHVDLDVNCLCYDICAEKSDCGKCVQQNILLLKSIVLDNYIIE